jgi:hypothetical protein
VSVPELVLFHPFLHIHHSAKPARMIKSSTMKERKNVTVTVCRTPEEVEKAKRQFLERLTPTDRIRLTWQLSQEQWGLKDDDESRLSRHHTRVIRR